MENIVYYFLIVFGAILVWISCNDLRKLKEKMPNGQKLNGNRIYIIKIIMQKPKN